MKVTVPVAVPPFCPVTVAVNVTACPKPEGFGVEAREVFELALLTVWLVTEEVLPVKFASPL